MLRAADPGVVVVDPTGPPVHVDLTLVDTLANSDHHITAAVVAAHTLCSGQVVILAWDISVESWMQALSKGCRGCIDKASTAEELSVAIRSIHRGEIYISPTLGITNPPTTALQRPLSPRETDMITLIVQGRTNTEIAESMYLSINTVKTYIRSAYTKIGIERRPDAVRWGIEQSLHLSKHPQPKATPPTHETENPQRCKVGDATQD